MMQFENRTGKNLNRKKLKILSVARNGAGELEELLVDIERADEEVTNEGSKIDAELMNNLINNMVTEKTKEILTGLFTDDQKVKFDLEKVEIPSEISKKVMLSDKGYFDTNYNWSVKKGENILIHNNELINRNITDKAEQAVILLEAKNNNIMVQKEFNCKINPLTVTDTINIYVEHNKNGESYGEGKIRIYGPSNITIKNNYSFSVKTSVSDDELLTVRVSTNNFPEGGLSECEFYVIIEDADDLNIYKYVRVIVNFVESYQPED